MFYLICSGCGIEYASKYRPRSERNFCTKVCANKHIVKRKRTKTCKVCGTFILANRVFCSDKCFSLYKETRFEQKKTSQKERSNAYIRSYYKKVKSLAVDYKGGKCVICQYNRCLSALEFHHVNPEEKDFTISGSIKAFSKLKPELDKCILVCSNCHKEIHAGITQLVEYLPLKQDCRSSTLCASTK